MTIKYNNSRPLVSVIMNCYNGEHYLAQAIKSVLNQTYRNFEVIFWDNHSKDKSAVIYKSFKDKRLKYYYAAKHTSLFQARNLAIKQSKGELIAFLDTDDYWKANKLALQVSKFKNSKISLVYSNYYILNQITGLKRIAFKNEMPEGIVFKQLLKNYFIGMVTVVFKRNIFKKNKKLFNNKYNIIGDFDLFTRISRNFNFAYIHLPLATYRVHNMSTTNNNYQQYVNELKLWLKNQKFFNKNFLFFIEERILFMEALINILNKRYLISIQKIFKISSFKKKIKLFIFLLITNFILKILKSNFS